MAIGGETIDLIPLQRIVSDEKYVILIINEKSNERGKIRFKCKQFQKTTNSETILSSEKFENNMLEIKEKPV